MLYDAIIIGSGPAGMTASIFLKRANRDVLIIEKSAPGGKVLSTATVENYPGYNQNSGVDLAMIMYQQVTELAIPFLFAEVTEIDKQEQFIVKASDQAYQAKRIIFAAGTIPKSLHTPNEAKFIGKGISYCAICDGSLYKNQDVVVIGAGNSAFEESLYLAKICRTVFVIARSSQFKADSVLIGKVKQTPNIQIFTNQEVVDFGGNASLEQVVIQDRTTGEQQILAATGAFIYIGFLPSTEILKKFSVLNQQGYVIVDDNKETAVSGLYAAGDCTEKTLRQIITAVSDGAICATAIVRSF